MATAAHIPIEVYLHSSYEPDAEYVDGDIEERHVGEYDHNAVQKAILIWFYLHEKEWQIRSIQEQRTRVSATRIRLPDVSVFQRSVPVEQVFTRPQLIAIEVLSPEDRRSKVDEKIADYRRFGGRTYLGGRSEEAHRLGLQFVRVDRDREIHGRRIANLPLTARSV